jgi:hypothetical protein
MLGLLAVLEGGQVVPAHSDTLSELALRKPLGLSEVPECRSKRSRVVDAEGSWPLANSVGSADIYTLQHGRLKCQYLNICSKHTNVSISTHF